MGRLKALLSHARQTDATRDATTRQGVSHVAPPRECDTRQRSDAGFPTPNLRAHEADDFDPYTQSDLADFDRLIRDDCTRHRTDPAPYLAMRQRIAPARIMVELRKYREACR